MSVLATFLLDLVSLGEAVCLLATLLSDLVSLGETVCPLATLLSDFVSLGEAVCLLATLLSDFVSLGETVCLLATLLSDFMSLGEVVCLLATLLSDLVSLGEAVCRQTSHLTRVIYSLCFIKRLHILYIMKLSHGPSKSRPIVPGKVSEIEHEPVLWAKSRRVTRSNPRLGCAKMSRACKNCVVCTVADASAKPRFWSRLPR